MKKQEKINLIGISGKQGSGKDEVTKIIQYLAGYCKRYPNNNRPYQNWKERVGHDGEWKNKKFSYKLKQISSVILGIPTDRFERRELKNSKLPEIWSRYIEDNFESNTPPIEESLTVREFLQRLGEGVRKTVHEDFWINALFKDYKREGGYEGEDRVASDGGYYSTPSYRGGYPKWIVSDVRYLNEIGAIRRRGGVVIRIDRNYSTVYGEPGIPATYSHTQFHESETSLDKYNNWDYIIENNGTLEELKDKVEEMLKHFGIINSAKTT